MNENIESEEMVMVASSSLGPFAYRKLYLGPGVGEAVCGC